MVHVGHVQAFEGLALMTAKLHHAVWHVVNQLACQGPGANFTEFWIERMIWYLKLYLKDRVKDNGEIIFLNDHLLIRSAQSCRARHPSHCQNLAERRGGARAMEFPTYDAEADSALLLGARVAGTGQITEEESEVVLDLLPKVLQQSEAWYRARGWPTVNREVLSCMLDQGLLLLDKFRQASLPSMDVIASVQDHTHAATTNQWVYVPYTYDGIGLVPCVAEVQYFVRVRADSGGLPVFDATGLLEEDASDDETATKYTVLEGDQLAHAEPLRLAVCKLWLADVCDSAAGCSLGDADIGILPDLLCLSNVGQRKEDTLPEKKNPRGHGAKRYFGYYLINIAEMETQLLPSVEMPGLTGRNTARRIRFFMTCSKMSGK